MTRDEKPNDKNNTADDTLKNTRVKETRQRRQSNLTMRKIFV